MAEATEKTIELDFDQAFRDFSSDGTPGKMSEEPEDAGETAEEGAEAPEEGAEASEEVAEEAAEDTNDEGEVSEEPEEAGETAEEDAEAPEEAAEGADDEDDRLLRRFADIVAKREKEAPETKEEPRAQEQPQAQEEPEIYTAEEQEILSEYEKEWPEIARAESLRRRAEYRAIVSYVFEQVAQQMRPITETVQTIAERTHYNDLASTVEDYDTVRDHVVQWVEEQPPYLQTAYKHVITQGTVEEVADLINRFKQETGRAQEKPQSTSPKKLEAELPTNAKKAVESLAPVSSKRTAPPKSNDLSDFDGAFERFASQLK